MMIAINIFFFQWDLLCCEGEKKKIPEGQVLTLLEVRQKFAT